MHPIERLRHVARAGGAPVDEVLRAAASSLAGFSDDPAALVPACRRLIERHAENGPVWWLAARVMAAADPGAEAWRCLDTWVSDRTVAELGHSLPQDGAVVVVGSPDRLLPAFASRGDVTVVVVDADGDGYGFVRRLDALDVRADTVDAARIGPAVAAADAVLLDVHALGPDGVVTAPGGWPVAAVAQTSQVPVWAVAGVGRVMAPPVWARLRAMVGDGGDVDVVAAGLVDRVAGPDGLDAWGRALERPDVPDLGELRF